MESPRSPSHTSRSTTYDVFLSFRGKDTRKNYVDVLYSFLDLRGIYTYKDDITLRRGETIHPSLVKAIKESQIAIVVFSKNYADSSWCLRELEFIMECSNKGDLIVIPIFFDVTTDDVKKLRGEFGEGFAKQESKHSSNTIESWKKALLDVTHISGWVTEDTANGHQAVGIKKIVDEVSQRLKPLVSDAKEDLIGIEKPMDDLIAKLKIGPVGVRMVGIWGIGGGGKTTLASSVHAKISSQFERSCFVEDIKSTKKLQKLQKYILSAVLKKKFEVQNVTDGKNEIKKRLSNCEKVLIVLDDVDDGEQLKALAGSRDWFGPGSRIIITTRDRHLLNVHNVDDTYNISMLNDHEAKWLFRRHALRRRGPIEDYQEIDRLSKEVVHYAGGLPLALKVLGESLCDKDMSEWISALDRLREIPNEDIVEQLKISYNGLKEYNTKQLFLDIACFFRQWQKDEAMEILDACGWNPVIGVKELELKALVTTSNGRLDMHDLIQDMGHDIVRMENPDYPEKRSRVWRVDEIQDMCKQDEETVNNDVKALHAPDFDAPSNLLQVVSNMKKLRSLHVSQDPSYVVEEPLFLSQKLRWISWKHYPSRSLPINFEPRHLVSLTLHNSLQEELWNGSKELPSLKVVDLSNSKNLIKTPDLQKAQNLKRLVLSGCINLKYMDPSVGRLKKLVYLNLDGCDKLEMFPPIVSMQKLESLILSGCSHLRKFPDIQDTLYSLKQLNLDKSGIEVLPSSIGRYCTNLVSISIVGCDNLKSINCEFRLSIQRCSPGGHDMRGW